MFFINNIKQEQSEEIIGYFASSIDKLKQIENINYMEILKNNIVSNISLAIVLWFLGTTIIGIPIVLGIIGYRGFCLGYTISSAILTLGSGKGIAFILATLVLHNIIFIPSIIAIGVSGFKLYKSIIKNKRRENIKVEILRHTIFSLIMSVGILISSVVETFGTTNILLIILKYL